MSWTTVVFFAIAITAAVCLIASLIVRSASMPEDRMRDMGATSTETLDLRKTGSMEARESMESSFSEYGKPVKAFTFVDCLEEGERGDAEAPIVLDYGIAVGFNDTGRTDRRVVRQVSYVLGTEHVEEPDGNESACQDRRRKINRISSMMKGMFSEEDTVMERATIADKAFPYVFEVRDGAVFD